MIILKKPIIIALSIMILLGSVFMFPSMRELFASLFTATAVEDLAGYFRA